MATASRALNPLIPNNMERRDRNCTSRTSAEEGKKNGAESGNVRGGSWSFRVVDAGWGPNPVGASRKPHRLKRHGEPPSGELAV
jgi:hypothetical protein